MVLAEAVQRVRRAGVVTEAPMPLMVSPLAGPAVRMAAADTPAMPAEQERREDPQEMAVLCC